MLKKDNRAYISFYNALIKEAYEDLASLLHSNLPNVSDPKQGSSDGSAAYGKCEAVGKVIGGFVGCAVSVWESTNAGCAESACCVGAVSVLISTELLGLFSFFFFFVSRVSTLSQWKCLHHLYQFLSALSISPGNAP